MRVWRAWWRHGRVGRQRQSDWTAFASGRGLGDAVTGLWDGPDRRAQGSGPAVRARGQGQRSTVNGWGVGAVGDGAVLGGWMGVLWMVMWDVEREVERRDHPSAAAVSVRVDECDVRSTKT